MAQALTPQRKVLAIADSQVGYSRYSDPKSGTKYARETQPVFWPGQTWLTANGVAYCDIFVTWVFWKALGEDFVKEGHLPAGASYNTDYRASKGGRVSKSEAAPGDVLVFDWKPSTPATNHVGILEKRLSGDRFQTIEGNTSVSSAGSQSNGGRVARRIRRHDQVKYVIRPNWSKAGGTSTSTTQPRWKTSKTIQGLSKAQVTEIQRQLQAKGYDLGKYGVDGSYGEATYKAVVAFQKSAGLAADGVAGPKTVVALKGAQSKPPAKPVTATKPASKPASAKSKAPAFPLPRKPGQMCFYGKGSEKTAVSGKMKNTLAPKDVVQDKHGKWYSKGLKVWQARLKERKWNITVDGRFGDETERIAKTIQKNNGITADGKIGPETYALAWE